MFDLTWERSIPIINIDFKKVQSIFTAYDHDLIVIDHKAIHLGCRNSNFVVSTNKGRYLLRMAPVNEINNEIRAFELVKNKIRVPELLFHVLENDINIFIYQYIDGVSLQEHIIKNGYCEPALLRQAAESAAIIHNIPKEKIMGFEKYDLPPFETWYQLFLDNPTVKNRLGGNLHGRIQTLVSDKQEFLPVINEYNSFIHCDFRPANMLVDAGGQVYFVDWESAGLGHSLADAGQFFRYRSFFNASQIEEFERVYNENAIRKLPSDWVLLSLFMDLINPLQMLSSNQEMTAKANDLINVVEKTLMYFGY